MSTVSMPLSLGYIKATAYADPGIRSAADIQICSFRGSATAPEIARALFSGEPPDILAFSVFGWNLYRFASIAETYRQLKPDGWIIMGGTHVANQAERLCRLYPAVDIIANGEGEFVFRDILQAYLGGSPANIAVCVSKLGGTSAVIVKTVIGAFGQFLAEVMPYVTIVKPSLEDARSLYYAGQRSAGQLTQ